VGQGRSAITRPFAVTARYHWFGFHDRDRSTGDDEHVYLSMNQLGRQLRQFVEGAICEARFNSDVLAIDIASVLQTRSKGCHDVCRVGGPPAAEIPR
jgi:hypothetical protein